MDTPEKSLDPDLLFRTHLLSPFGGIKDLKYGSFPRRYILVKETLVVDVLLVNVVLRLCDLAQLFLLSRWFYLHYYLIAYQLFVSLDTY